MCVFCFYLLGGARSCGIRYGTPWFACRGGCSSRACPRRLAFPCPRLRLCLVSTSISRAARRDSSRPVVRSEAPWCAAGHGMRFEYHKNRETLPIACLYQHLSGCHPMVRACVRAGWLPRCMFPPLFRLFDDVCFLPSDGGGRLCLSRGRLGRSNRRACIFYEGITFVFLDSEPTSRPH